MQKDKLTVAAFDFDGTISYCDSLIPFLWSMAGTGKTIKNLCLCTPVFLQFLRNKNLRQSAKEKLLETFLKGQDYTAILLQGETYAQGILNKLIKSEALDRILWHKSQKHTLVLVSANLSAYLMPWAKKHGIDYVLASELELDEQKRITGRLRGLNCWGEEKVRRLKNLFGSKENYTLYAYGNSRGDRELLELADYPFYRKFQ